MSYLLHIFNLHGQFDFVLNILIHWTPFLAYLLGNAFQLFLGQGGKEKERAGVLEREDPCGCIFTGVPPPPQYRFLTWPEGFAMFLPPS